MANIGQLEEARKTIKEMEKEQEWLVGIFSEERERRDMEEARLRKELVVSFLAAFSLMSKDYEFLERERERESWVWF